MKVQGDTKEVQGGLVEFRDFSWIFDRCQIDVRQILDRFRQIQLISKVLGMCWIDLDRFIQIQIDVSWIQIDLYRFRQIQIDLDRFREIQIDLDRFRQIQIDLDRFRQIQIDLDRFSQIQNDLEQTALTTPVCGGSKELNSCHKLKFSNSFIFAT